MNLLQLNIRAALHLIVYAESQGCADVGVAFTGGGVGFDAQFVAPKPVEFIEIDFEIPELKGETL